MSGLTLDAGALIGFERGDRRVLTHLKAALERGEEMTVPTAALAEAWRGGPRGARIARLLTACAREPLHEDLARSAGEAIGAVRGASVVDAVVMASAATRGDHVLTSDFDDLDRLRAYFPAVRLFRV
jgi:hypothetical protein